jgi:Zn-dependent protease
MTLPTDEILTNIVGRIFRIDDVTSGEPARDKYLYRFRGQIVADDSAEAYDQLAEALKPHQLTPLFRVEDKRHVIYLVRELPRPSTGNLQTNIVMLILTLISVFMIGATYAYEGPPVSTLSEYYAVSLRYLLSGWPYALSLMAILLAHEFGHYLASRYHKMAATLPYFIPMPLPGSFGTMGAVIQLKEQPKNRRVLLDVGMAGPLSGLVVAIPLMLIGLHFSKIGTVEPGGMLEGNSILYLFLKYVSFGHLFPAPASYDGVAPVLYWARYLLTGTPSPVGGTDVFLHPVAWAAWVGFLVTAINLVPAGQLDGGHLLYVLVGKANMQRALPVIMISLGLLGIFWQGWWLWVFLLLVFGRIYAEPLDMITELDPKRRLYAVLGLIVFLLVFIPVPLVII